MYDLTTCFKSQPLRGFELDTYRTTVPDKWLHGLTFKSFLVNLDVCGLFFEGISEFN